MYSLLSPHDGNKEDQDALIAACAVWAVWHVPFAALGWTRLSVDGPPFRKLL